NVERRVQLHKKITERFFEPAVPGEGQVDDRTIKLPSQHGGPGQARTGRAASLGNGCTVNDDGPFVSGRQGLESCIFRYSDLKPFYLVVQGEVQIIFPVRVIFDRQECV